MSDYSNDSAKVLTRLSESHDSEGIISGEKEANLGPIEECDLELRRIEVKQRQEELDGQKQDRDQRLKFANQLFTYLCIYSLSILGLLFLSGSTWLHFKLSDNVLIALITTSFGHAVGVFIYVPKYLYSRKHNRQKEEG